MSIHSQQSITRTQRESEPRSSPTSPAPAYQSIQSSPPQYFILPMTPRSGSLSAQPVIVLPLPNPQMTPSLRRMSPTSIPIPPIQSRQAEGREGNAPSTIESISRAASLTRRRRHSATQSPPQTQEQQVREEHYKSVPSTMRSTTMPAELTREGTAPDHHSRNVSGPILAELPPQSPGAVPHADSKVPISRPPIPEFEDLPPSPGSIASTAMSPELIRKRTIAEKGIGEVMEEIMRSDERSRPISSGEYIEIGVSTSRSPQPVASSSRTGADHQPRLSDASLSPATPQREPSQPSRSHRPTKSQSSASQRSHSNDMRIMSPTAPDPLYPSQLTGAPSPELREATATPLSYASLNQAQPKGSREFDVPLSIKTSSLPPSNPGQVWQYHETPSHTMQLSPKTQSPRLGHDGGSKNTSPLGSTQRSIPSHESPRPEDIMINVNLGPDTDAPSLTSPSSPPRRIPTLRRRNRESVSHPDQIQSPRVSQSISTYSELPVGINPSPGHQNYSEGVSNQRSNSSGTHKTWSTSQPAQALLIPANVPPRRTLDSVRSQVASEIAFRAVSKSSLTDGTSISTNLHIIPACQLYHTGVRTGVADASSASKPDDIPFIHLIASSLTSSFTLSSAPYLFLIITSSTSPNTPGLLYITSSSQHITSRAITLCSSKFLNRITQSSFTSSSPSDPDSPDGLGLATQKEWIAVIKNLNESSFDSDILHVILLNAARAPLDPMQPPSGSKSVDIMLKDARARLQRITPRQALTELRSNVMDVPTILVDIRPQAQRDEWGGIKGALVIERNVLEWRFDPRCEARLDIADRYDLRVIVFCQEGYTSRCVSIVNFSC